MRSGGWYGEDNGAPPTQNRILSFNNEMKYKIIFRNGYYGINIATKKKTKKHQLNSRKILLVWDYILNVLMPIPIYLKHLNIINLVNLLRASVVAVEISF